MRIAVTGGIGSGKSAVAALLSARGAVVVDADRIAREVVEPGTPGLAAVIAEFGDGILADDGSLGEARTIPEMEEPTALLEHIKAELPVWKKEILADGSHTWVGIS